LSAGGNIWTLEEKSKKPNQRGERGLECLFSLIKKKGGSGALVVGMARGDKDRVFQTVLEGRTRVNRKGIANGVKKWYEQGEVGD